MINNSDFNSKTKIVAISEFWEQEQYIINSSKYALFKYDLASKRTGLYSSDYIGMKFLKSETYYSKYNFIYNAEAVILYIVHLRSPRNSEDDSYSLNQNIIKQIADEINANYHKYSIIMGDFNLPHYDKLFTDHFHLNTTDYFYDKARSTKTYEKNSRLKFYSPINSFNGDLSKGPPGTFYYGKRSRAQNWYILDNILISYPLSKFIDKDSCEIMTKFSDENLVTKLQLPNRLYSDHLPVKIKLK
ncbi:hypothetical protein CH365_19640 [Leptospira neocaledonica]|uniref:Endonuclease/exonuclease/phosphatase domain-containing protein n=1 Tax=Leptospira neocaledonica TaxID=2023192 RepID=A0A2M9ZTE8_9LEPT|nr:hypothetical protein CH365_19640 [Leptospira neocaledonica]